MERERQTERESTFSVHNPSMSNEVLLQWLVLNFIIPLG
jgi:hypothetical protein